MPRVTVPNYPYPAYKFVSYPLSVNSVFDYQWYTSASSVEIVNLYQTFGIVHSFCPGKKCSDMKKKCIYKANIDKLQCEYCKTEYPSRPEAFFGLLGTPQQLITHLFLFACRAGVQVIKDWTGFGLDKIRRTRKRLQAVLQIGMENDDIKLGDGIDNPIITDDLQKGNRRKGNGDQPSKPTVIHGAINGIADNDHYKFCTISDFYTYNTSALMTLQRRIEIFN